ncbi:MAG: adenylate kinase [Treponema sp.]|jgi:adenylate kinase|nr:adenylate kinase [Treponema sp.]MDR1218198.1 adenylate kinase [Treponema sp.]
MKLIFLGPPGAGKGTLAVRVKELLNTPHISTGAIFREAIAAKTALGLTVKAIIDAGKLVDDETTIALVKERLAQADAQKGYILDGFPRTIAQAEALATFSPVDKVVNFDIPDSGVIERLSGRRVCRKCGFNWHKVFNPPKRENVCDTCGGEVYTRDDDKPEAIGKRLEVYREQTAPLIAFYRAKGVLVDIDASPMVDEILISFKKAMGLQTL